MISLQIRPLLINTALLAVIVVAPLYAHLEKAVAFTQPLSTDAMAKKAGILELSAYEYDQRAKSLPLLSPSEQAYAQARIQECMVAQIKLPVVRYHNIEGYEPNILVKTSYVETQSSAFAIPVGSVILDHGQYVLNLFSKRLMPQCSGIANPMYVPFTIPKGSILLPNGDIIFPGGLILAMIEFNTFLAIKEESPLYTLVQKAHATLLQFAESLKGGFFTDGEIYTMKMQTDSSGKRDYASLFNATEYVTNALSLLNTYARDANKEALQQLAYLMAHIQREVTAVSLQRKVPTATQTASAATPSQPSLITSAAQPQTPKPLVPVATKHVSIFKPHPFYNTAPFAPYQGTNKENIPPTHSNTAAYVQAQEPHKK